MNEKCFRQVDEKLSPFLIGFLGESQGPQEAEQWNANRRDYL